MSEQQQVPVEEPEPNHQETPVIDQQPKSPDTSAQPQQQQTQDQPVAPAYTPPEFQKPLPDSMKEYRQVPPDGTAATKLPRGLEPLLTARQLVVKHDSEMIETKCKCYQQCHYEVYNEKHQVIYYAVENINVYSVCCMTKYRPYRMRIYDQLQYNCAYFMGTITFLFQRCVIEVPVKELKATITKVKGEQAEKPYFDVLNDKGELIFKINPSPDDKIGKFDIFGPDKETKIGWLSNEWSGFFQEAFPGKDTFGVSLPLDLDVSWKTVMLGCLFFIDYLIYESK